MNFIDRTIAVFAPSVAVKRVRARRTLEVMNYSQHGASTKKNSMAGWQTRAGSALQDIERNVEKLRERSRDLYMGAPIATGALKTLRTNVVGSGLQLNPQIDAEYLGLSAEEADAWENTVEREFRLWAEDISCDMQRMNNFYELQQLAFLAQMMSGDVFVLLPIRSRVGQVYDLRINIIEADRVCSPKGNSLTDTKIFNGVEVNGWGEVVAYHIAKHHPSDPGLKQNSWSRIPKFGSKTGRQNILHLMETERPEQRRGVPILAPVIESLKQLSRYTDAELMAAVISAMHTIFVTSTAEQGNQDMFGGISDEDLIDDENEESVELGNGNMIFLAEGEQIQESNPGRPNSGFEGFMTAMCRQIGAALEIPYELLLKNFTSSYSASRGALLEAWKMFRMRRSWLANDFCQPIYEEWLHEAIAKGRISAPGFFTDPLVRKAYSQAEWNGPSQGQIDPLKEVNAAEKRVKNGFSTRAQETVALNGGDFKKNIRTRMMEEQMMGGLLEDAEEEQVLEHDKDDE